MEEEKVVVPETVQEEKKSGPKKGVSQEEFTEFKSSVDTALSRILENLQNLQKPVVATTLPPNMPIPNQEGGPTIGDQVPVPPAWAQLKDLILGKDFDGFREDMPSGEIKYNIIVPREKSNADTLHWQNFKVDKRTIVVKNGERSVKEGLIKIRNNLIAAGKQLVQYP